MYHHIMLIGKVKNYGSPDRLVFWMQKKVGRRARIETIKRCWTRKTSNLFNGLDRGHMKGESINKVKTYV